MKKLIFVIASLTLLLGGCTYFDVPNNQQATKKSEKEPHEKYAEQIAQELNANDWSYTWEYLLPKKEDILIDFYTWEPIIDHTVWLCNEKECKLIRTEHY